MRIAEQVVEYLKNGVAINAVNMPSLSPEQYRSLEPYIHMAERLGIFAAYIASGQSQVRPPHLLRPPRRTAPPTCCGTPAWRACLRAPRRRRRPTWSMPCRSPPSAAGTWWSNTSAAPAHTDSILLELETDCGVTRVEGSVLLGKPRLMQVDGIYCEAPLDGQVVYMRNQDVPGVIGHVGTVLGRNSINIANFSLGRRDAALAPGEPLEAIAVVSTDGLVPESVLAQLRENPAVKLARSVEFRK